MEMHQVRYFLAAARTLNFTRAASECNVTQPSLTRAIQKLEEEFGGELFRRERSLTHLTELGRLMVPHLERTFDAANAAKMLARGLGKDVQAPIAFGLGGGLSSHLLAALAEVTDALPGFQLSLLRADSAALVQALIKGEVDAAILAEPRERVNRFDRVELCTEDYCIIARRDSALATNGMPTLEQLTAVSWIESDSDVAAEFRELCQGQGIVPEFRHTASSEDDLVTLVGAGMGCALAPVRRELPEGVIAVRHEALAIRRPVVFVTVAGRRRSPATDALLRAVRARSWTH